MNFPAKQKKLRFGKKQFKGEPRTTPTLEGGATKEKQKLSLTNRNVLKEGYLTKEGAKFKTWKKRVFRLTPFELRYYKPGSFKKPAGIIHLNSNSFVSKTLRGIKDRKNCFQIRTEKRTYYITAEDGDKMNEWTDAIRDTAKLRKRISVMHYANTTLRSATKHMIFNKGIGSGSHYGRKKTKSFGVNKCTSLELIGSGGYELGEVRIKHKINEKKLERKTGMTLNQEFDMNMASLEIFCKPPNERTAQEKAYAISMQEYCKKIHNYSKKFSIKPKFGMAGGTYIFWKNESDRTSEEQDFVKKMKVLYLRKIKNMDPSLKMNREILASSTNVFRKLRKERTKEEDRYINNLTILTKDIVSMERKYGVKAKFSLVTSVLPLSKYKEERTSRDVELIYHVENNSFGEFKE